jgi:hypothetical protein
MWHVWGIGQMYNLQGFRERPDGKMPFARTRRRWENNNIMDIQDVI